MNYTFFTLTTALISCGLFLGMMALMEAGRRIGLPHSRDPDGTRAGVGPIEGNLRPTRPAPGVQLFRWGRPV